MYSALGTETLKTGETLRIGVVECPDAAWAERVADFLGHKNSASRDHIRRALDGPLDDLTTRFYVGCIDDAPAAQIMIVSSRGVGILGHVFTSPHHRRKGACSEVMRYQMEDMDRAEVQVLCLSTRFEGPPYAIYHGFGFRSIGPNRGQMIWRAHTGAEADMFAPGSATVRSARWSDWPWFDLLGMQPVADDEVLPRAASLDLKDYGSLESAFVPVLLKRDEDPRIQALVLESEHGATVGFALAQPDRRWFGDVFVADLYVHPAFRGHEREMLSAIAWPDLPVITYRSLHGGRPYGNAAAWQEAGFGPVATLPQWVEFADQRHDLELWVRWHHAALD